MKEACLLLALTICCAVKALNLDNGLALPGSFATTSPLETFGRKLLSGSEVTRDILVYIDKSTFPPDDLEWAGIGAEPDNDHYKDFTGKVLSAVYLEKTPEDIGVTASITKVERRHPPKKQQMCSTAPALFVFSLGFKFQFETLTGGKAEQVVDLMETSIKRVLRCLPTQMPDWAAMRQAELDAIPSLENQKWGSQEDRVKEFMLDGTFDFKAIRIFDGDTIWAAVIVRNKAWRINCRLLGIDTPEIPRSHADAMDNKASYFARDRLVELLTGIKIDHNLEYEDTSGTPLPSFSDRELQKKLDAENTAIIHQGLTLHGTGKFGRYLATLKSIDGQDVAQVLLDEGHAVPFMAEEEEDEGEEGEGEED